MFAYPFHVVFSLSLISRSPLLSL